MTEQLDLPVKTLAPDVSAEEVAAVCDHLRGKGWITAREIGEVLHVTDRHLRGCAEHSDGRLISGQRGYRLFDETTPLDEADQAATWLESQATKMIRRGAAIRRRYHRYART